MPYGAGQDSFLGLCLAFSPCQTEAIADHSGRQANAEGGLVPLHRGFDSLNVNLSWPELWDRLGPFWRGPFWL